MEKGESKFEKAKSPGAEPILGAPVLRFAQKREMNGDSILKSAVEKLKK